MGEISIREKGSKIELEPSQQYINITYFKYTLGRGKGNKNSRLKKSQTT
jgi:hypothetical protein